MSRRDRDWTEYEHTVFEHFRLALPEATVVRDARLFGFLSNRSRQIDVLITDTLPDSLVRTVADAKHHKRAIDVKDVEAFIGLLRDVGVERGILVCPAGYSASAYRRAFADDVDLDLEILNFEELGQWQGLLAIPYSESLGVLMPAPLGWVIDAEKRPGILAALYQRGLTLSSAGEKKEWMYVNIWHRRPPARSLNELLEIQERKLVAAFPDAKISVAFPHHRASEKVAIRHMEEGSYPTVEVTGFVEFDEFIFFAALFTPLVVQRRNTRKLEYLLKKVVPTKIRREAL